MYEYDQKQPKNRSQCAHTCGSEGVCVYDYIKNDQKHGSGRLRAAPMALTGAQKGAIGVLSTFIWKTQYEFGGAKFATIKTLNALERKGIIESSLNDNGEKQWRILKNTE